jgi:hypothetical protein
VTEERETLIKSRRLTLAYVAMGVLVLLATSLAIISIREASSGQGACAYQRATYPAAHAFRVEIKEFVHGHYVHLTQEAEAYRDSAALEQDRIAARLDLQLALITERHAREALRHWRKITLPGPPTCSG